MDRVRGFVHTSPNLSNIVGGVTLIIGGISGARFAIQRTNRNRSRAMGYGLVLLLSVGAAFCGLIMIYQGMKGMLQPKPFETTWRPPSSEPHCNLWVESHVALGQLPTPKEVQQCLQTAPSDGPYKQVINTLGGPEKFCKLPVYPTSRLSNTAYLKGDSNLGIHALWRGRDDWDRPFVVLRLRPVQKMEGCHLESIQAVQKRYSDKSGPFRDNWVASLWDSVIDYINPSNFRMKEAMTRLLNVTQGKPIVPRIGSKKPICLLKID